MMMVQPAAASCTDDWSELVRLVAANNLTPAKDLQRLAMAKFPGKLVKISLCQANDGYQLVFLNPGGQLVDRSVDAHNPFPQ